MELQAIFEQADQCLVIDDPIQGVLDQIHNGITQSGTAAYFLSKLPLAVTLASVDPAEVLLRRTFAAYRARLNSDEDWISTRVAAAVAARTNVELAEEKKWIEQVASATGLSVQTLQHIVDLADAGSFDGTAVQAVAVLLSWLARDPIILMELVRPENLEGLFGTKYKKLPSDAHRAQQALSAIGRLLPLWMSGAPLCDLEAAFLGSVEKLGRCEYARHFVSRVVPDLAFIAGLPARLLIARGKQASGLPTVSTVLATLGSVVREGCDSPEALATRINCGRDVSRVAARKMFSKITRFAPVGNSIEEFEATRQRMRAAEAISSFTTLLQ
jgi:hypothetical protein